MMKTDIRPLTAADLEPLHLGFLEAFSDYMVKMTPSRSQFEEMLRRRGYVAEASAGAFEGNQLVGFALNCIEGTRGYNTGTGVVPSHRRRGLGNEVMEFSHSLLRARGCSSYVLEVLEQNHAAIGLYRAGEFAEGRRFQCWAFEAVALEDTEPLVGRGAQNWQDWQTWWSILPAWQNSTSSLQRAGDQHLVLGNDDGYAIVFPATGDLPQFAVRPGARRRGVGTKLLCAAAAVAKKPLRILHLDDRDSGIATFLEKAGATRTFRTIEMERAL